MTQQLEPAMARCEVTGKMVPEDELVTLNGQRVCAEGKAILLDRLKAGETMPGEFEKPTVGRRFGCIFLDGLVLGIPLAIVNGLARAEFVSPQIVGVVSLITSALQTIYFGQMHAARGQTLGKMAGKLKVLNLDGSKISFNTAYIRAIAYTGPSFISGIALLLATPTALTGATSVVAVYSIVDVLCALFDRNMQRALHDRIAGTRVVYLA